MRQSISSGSPYEAQFGFCRAVRIGNRILVAGTAPIAPDGTPAARDNPYGQAQRCFDIIAQAIEQLGGRLAHVVRTRMYITRHDVWPEVARAHGERFGAIGPAATAVIVAGLLDPAWLVEIEAEAEVQPAG